MAIFHTSSVLILVSIIFISISPLSIGHKLTDTDIKNLCSKTTNHESCYILIKSDHRTINVDAKGLAEVSIDLASSTAHRIHSQISSFAKATTHDSQLRKRYTSCSKNYNDAIRDLGVARNNLHSNAYRNISVQVRDATQEIINCEKVFDGASNDHANIKEKSHNFEFVLNIVKVMSDNLNKKNQ